MIRLEPAGDRPIDVLTFGETLALFRSTGVGPLAHNTRFELSVGGADSNVAIAVARLGGVSAWCGRVGADSFGDVILRELRAEGVQLHATIDPDAPTAHMVREVRTPALARVTYARAGSAGSRITPADVPAEALRAAKILHVTGITPALSASALETTLATVAAARSSGVVVSFDVNHRSSLWSPTDARAVYRRIARHADVVFAGEDEARLLLDESGAPEDLARGIAGLGPTQVVIKLGSRGCLAFIDDVILEAPGVSIDPVDTVGAGDAFVGGYLAELAVGCRAEQRVATANSTGAFACLSAGDWSGLPRRTELALLAATEPVIR